MKQVHLILAMLIGVAVQGCASIASSNLPPGTIQKGSLANQKLIRDAMLGVSAKAGTFGCKKLDSFQPYIVAMPQGSPGSRIWREKWIVKCDSAEYPIGIRFSEAGLGAANYTVE